MRVDIYLANLSEGNISVGMTDIAPGKTEKILQKDFERKASYIDRMIKEGKLSFGNSGSESEESAPAEETTSDVKDDKAPEKDPVVTAEPEDKAGEDTTEPDSDVTPEVVSSEADASDATEKEAVTEEKIEEAPVKEEPEVIETVAAPKRTKRTK